MIRILAATAAISIAAGCPPARAADPAELATSIGLPAAGDLAKGAVGVVERLSMPVSTVRAGDSASAVERVLGRPTLESRFDAASGDNRVLVYADQPVQTRVTIRRGMVSEIRLELASIDKSRLPPRARMAVPFMTRGGLLALLGRPTRTEHWAASGLEIEQMVFADRGEPDFSAFLADALVVDLRPGTERPTDIGRVILPAAVADTAPDRALCIGMTREAAAALLGRAASTTISSFKGQEVAYLDHDAEGDHGQLILTFTGGVLTRFTLWPAEESTGLRTPS